MLYRKTMDSTQSDSIIMMNSKNLKDCYLLDHNIFFKRNVQKDERNKQNNWEDWTWRKINGSWRRDHLPQHCWMATDRSNSMFCSFRYFRKVPVKTVGDYTTSEIQRRMVSIDKARRKMETSQAVLIQIDFEKPPFHLIFLSKILRTEKKKKNMNCLWNRNWTRQKMERRCDDDDDKCDEEDESTNGPPPPQKVTYFFVDWNFRLRYRRTLCHAKKF